MLYSLPSPPDTGADETEGEVYAAYFFDLANSSTISYSVSSQAIVSVTQDPAAVDTTGGIVWESCYLLLGYLLSSPSRCPSLTSLSRCVELGAGCGLLSLSLHASLGSAIVATEVPPFERPSPRLSHSGGGEGGQAAQPSGNKKKKARQEQLAGGEAEVEGLLEQEQEQEQERPVKAGGPFNCLKNNVDAYNVSLVESGRKSDPSTPSSVLVSCLDWLSFPSPSSSPSSSSSLLAPSSFDFVFGTDVVFSLSLVRPLLDAARRLVKKPSGGGCVGGICFFACQVRCALAWSEFLSCMSEYFDVVDNISREAYDMDECRFGESQEIFLYRLGRAKDDETWRTEDEERKTKKEKKEKKKKRKEAERVGGKAASSDNG